MNKYLIALTLLCAYTFVSAQKIIIGQYVIGDSAASYIKFDPLAPKADYLCFKNTNKNLPLLINVENNTKDSTFYDQYGNNYDFSTCTSNTSNNPTNYTLSFFLNYGFNAYALGADSTSLNGLSIFSVNLEKKKRKKLGESPVLSFGGMYINNHELYIIGFDANFYKIDTSDTKKKQIISQLPIDLQGLPTTDPIIIEDCDSSKMILLESFSNSNTVYKAWICSNLDDLPYQFTETNIVTNAAKGIYDIEYAFPTLNRLSCIDLDRNNSTTAATAATRKDYNTVMCGKQSVVCDSDIKLKTRPGFADSLRVWLTDDPDGVAEKITLTGALPAGVTLKSTPKSMMFYFPAVTGEPKIEALIKQIVYENTATKPSYGTRKVHFYLYASRLVSDPAIAHIEIRKPDSTSTTQSACTGQSIVVQGMAYSKDTLLQFVLPNRFGCDSLHKVALSFKPKLQGTNKQTICNNTSYLFGNQTLTTSGVYT
jgi:hypothetical protein